METCLSFAISLAKFTVDVELSNNYQEFKSEINRCLSYVAGAPCKNLNLLKLCQLFITDEWLSNLISELPFREYIHIHLWMILRSIKILSGSLRKLFFRSHDMLDEFKLDTPNLRIWNILVIWYSSLQTLWLCRKLHCFSARIILTTSGMGNQLNFLQMFNRCSKVLNLECDPEVCCFPSKLFYLNFLSYLNNLVSCVLKF